MAKNNVSLAVVYEGERTRLNENLEKAIQEELRRVTGLNHEGVTLSPKRRVKVTLLAQVGKKQGESYTGVSNESLDEAIKDASKDGQVQFDPSKVKVELEVIAQAPYFTVPVISRSLDESKIHDYQFQALKQLADTYGTRLSSEPASVEYVVMKMKTAYTQDRELPHNHIGGKNIVVKGKSQKSLDDAELQAKTNSTKVGSVIFEQTYQAMVYGEPEESLIVRRGVSEPIVVVSGVPTVVSNITSGAGRQYGQPRPKVSYGTRSEATSAAAPVHFTSSNVLM